MQAAGGMQTAQNFQNGIPLPMAPAAQAATDNLYDCTQFLVCAAGAASSSLLGGGGLTGGGEAVLERGAGNEVDQLLLNNSNRVAARFLTNSAGETLDTMRVTIPEGKFGYLLKNPSKAGVFSDSMGFDQSSLDSALRSHLVDNFGNALESVPMTGGGTKFTVTGSMTGPSGQSWNITTAWGVDTDGTVRLITATP